MKTAGQVWTAASGTFLLAFALHAPAQEVTASITGVVSDATGAVIPGAVVTVLDTDRSIVRRTLKTSTDGHYSALLLPIGHYMVAAEAPGFKTGKRAGIKLNVNDSWVVNFVLRVGMITQELSVESNVPQVDLQSPAAGGVISGREIRSLPLNTRNYALLVALQPGVSANLAVDQLYVGITGPHGTLNVLNFSVNGSRPDQNNWTLDGADNLDRGRNLSLLTYPSAESIEEFRLLRSNYSPEFPSGSGGQVISMTRSGTSHLHGSAYEFFRNDMLAANNFFNNRYGIPRPPIRYNNFGFTIGGPVYIPGIYNPAKNKTFFFYSEEWRRVIDYSTFISGTMPNLAQQHGTFTNPVCTEPIYDPDTHACIGPTTTQIDSFDPTAAAYIQDIYSKLPAPEPNGDIVTAATNHYDFRGESVRVDHVFGPRLSVFGRFINDDIPTVEPGGLFQGLPLPAVATTRTNAPGRGLAVRATQIISPTFLNEAGYAYSYGAIVSDPIGLASTDVSTDIRPILPFPSPLHRVPDLNFFAGQSINGFGQYRDFNRNHEVLDTLTKVAGKHTLKAGFAYNHYEKEENRGRDTNGAYSFYGFDPHGNYTFEQEWASFLLGNVANFSQASVGPPADIRQNIFEWFVQDEFRARPNLTLTLGFRWSFFRQPFDGHGNSSSFDPAAFDKEAAPEVDITTGLLVSGTKTPIVNGIIISGKNSPFGKAISRQNNLDIAPRVGVAWDPFRKGKTAIRAGYGLFFDNTSKSIHETAVFQNPPLVRYLSVANTNLTDPASVAPDLNLIPSWAAGMQANWRSPYAQQWSLDVQQQIGSSAVLAIGYYGNRSLHLPSLVDINEPVPGAYLAAGVLPHGPIFPDNTQLLNYVRRYRGYNSIDIQSTLFSSNYNSLQAQFQTRIRNNTQLTINYTWSHALTNAGDLLASPQNIYDPAAEYGNSPFDRTHILTASYIYTLPFKPDQRGVTGHLLGGWELSGVVYAETGVPLTVVGVDRDPAGLGFFGFNLIQGRPDQVGDPNRHAPHTIDRWFNTEAFAAPPEDGIRPGSAHPASVRGPGAIRLDAAATKNTRIGDRCGLEFRAEANNALNHTNLDGANTFFLDRNNFGRVGGARDPRIVQLSLKVIF